MDTLDYVRPHSLADALEALAQPGARILAGGTDLIVQLREKRRQASQIVDVKHVQELSAVREVDDGSLIIGSAAAASKLARDHRIRERYPALATSLGMIGSVQIQNRATLGGNICNAAPSADAVPPLISYGAQCLIRSPNGERSIALEGLFDQPGRPRLEADELLVALQLPAPTAQSAASYRRFTPRREMDIAVVGVGSWIAIGDDGTIAAARIALASVAPRPIRALGAEAVLVGQLPCEAIFRDAAEAAMVDATPISDTRGSADYRRQLVRTLTVRTLTDSQAMIGA